MDLSAFLAILSGIVVIIGGPSYFVDIIIGTTKPQRTTWFIWSLLGVIAFVAQVKLGAHWSLLFSGLDAAGNLAIFLLSLKYGVGGWTKLDKIGLTVATIGLAISFIAHSPLLAICGVILADLAGAVLTVIKTYRAPKSETFITWLAVGTSALLGALSVGKLDAGLLLYPMYLALANYAVLIAILIGKNRNTYKAQNTL